MTDKKGPKLDLANTYPVSPLCDIEVPTAKWTPGVNGGNSRDQKFIKYIESKSPAFPPHGWRDITPYFGKQWPKSLSAWRTSASKHGYYVSVKLITKDSVTYRAILVCRNPK